ncbi:DUF6881 domain-containing protein [Methylophilus sp. 3sh_L]|uniref:DUF6881 domain-containing protein n=1 Tax=Methylophilus sp. 3sh_L TaxID=3377114 RepID=UPI00398E57DC
MEYIDVKWIHQDSKYPVRLVSELDESRYEIRKLEFFSRGEVGFASAGLHSDTTELGTAPVPPLDEINSSSEFLGAVISQLEFEKLWSAHGPKNA